MAAFSNFLEDKVLDHLFGGTPYVAPSTLYIALFLADDGLESGIITSEVSGNAYARVSVDPATDMGAASSGSIANINELIFPTASGTWGTVTHAAIMDAAVSGTVLAHGALTTQKGISAGDTARYAVGELVITLD